MWNKLISSMVITFLVVMLISCSQKFDKHKLIYYEKCKDIILVHFEFFMKNFQQDTAFTNLVKADGTSSDKKVIDHIDKDNFFCADKQRLIALENVEGGMFLKDFNRILWENKLVTEQSDICTLNIMKDSTIYFILSQNEGFSYNKKYIAAYDIHNKIKEIKINKKAEDLKGAYNAEDLEILFSKGKWKYFKLKTPHVE